MTLSLTLTRTITTTHLSHPIPSTKVYESPDGAWIVAIDKDNDEVVFVEPGARGNASSVAHTVAASEDHCALDDQSGCGGKPDKVAFHSRQDGSTDFFFSFTSPQDRQGTDGIGYINSKEIEAGQKTLHHVGGGSGASKYRAIRAGGGYVATIMAYPFEGVMLVDADADAEDAKLNVATVKTNEGPSRVLYVPRDATGAYCENA